MIILTFALRCWWSTEEKTASDDFVSQLQQQTSCCQRIPSEVSRYNVKTFPGSRRSPSPIHSYGKRTSGRGDFFTCLSWSSAFEPRFPLRAACFPPSHRLRFVFMLGNQKQPVSLAAASWLIKHEAAMTTTKSSPPPPPPQDRRPAVLPRFLFFQNGSMQTWSDLKVVGHCFNIMLCDYTFNKSASLHFWLIFCNILGSAHCIWHTRHLRQRWYLRVALGKTHLIKIQQAFFSRFFHIYI